MKRILLSTVLAVACAGTAFAANTVPMQTISGEAARKMVDACMAIAAKTKAPIAIAVVDHAGNLVDFHRMDGGSVIAVESSILKAKTAVRWRRSTREVHENVMSGRNRSPEWIGDFPQPGALVVKVDDQVVGAIGIGGGANDEPCAHAGIEAAFGPQPPLSAPAPR
jgi:glc operon protein GlcG